jgi:streptogramin lyase
MVNPATSRSTSELVINEGHIVHPRLYLRDSAGAHRDDFDASVTSLDTSVAEPDQWGNIRGKAAGFATLTISAGGRLIGATATVVNVQRGATGVDIVGIAQDQAQRLYMASSTDHVILKAEELKQNPVIYAGVSRTPGLQNGPRAQSLFSQPAFVALNNQADGSIYVSDGANNAIRKISPGTTGAVETLAGGLNNPQGIALDYRGYLWIAESGAHTIRRIHLATGAVQLVAGQAGAAGFADGVGAAARFNHPIGLAIEPETTTEQIDRQRTGASPPPVRVIVADSGNGVLRRISETGQVVTIPGSFTSPTSVAVDPVGNFYVSESTTDRVKVILRKTGEVTEASEDHTFNRPAGIAISRAGKVLVADHDHAAQEIQYGQPRITSITPNHVSYQGGTALTIEGANFAPDSIVIVGGVELPCTVDSTSSIRFTAPSGAKALPSGITTVTVLNRGGLGQAPLDFEAIGLSQLPSGYVTTVAGGSTFVGDGAAAVNAGLQPEGVAVDSAGNLFIVDTANSRIRRVDVRTGIITTVAGNGQEAFAGDGGPAILASLLTPHDVAFDSAGNLLISEFWAGRIRRVDAQTGIIQTIAGAPGQPYGIDGPALQVGINPVSFTLDSAGNIFVTEYLGSRVKRIDAKSQMVTTIAGIGSDGYSGDGGPAVNAALNRPVGVAVDKDGNVYIGDTDNAVIRRIDAVTHVITTVVGTHEFGFCNDGTPALSCQISSPRGLVFDAEGNLLFSDPNPNRHRVRKLTFATGTITTIAGRGDSDEGFSGDGGPATRAGVLPGALALDAAGNLFIAHNPGYPGSRVRRVDGSKGIITTVAGNGVEAFVGDNGIATSATLHDPRAIAFDSGGNLFAATAGFYFSRVRKVDGATQVITTAMGCLEGCSQAAGTLAPRFQLFEPWDVAFDRDGNMYVSALYCCVLKVDAITHTVSYIAGGGNPIDGVGDGGPATAARMFPGALALDQSGGRNGLYIADLNHRTVRRMNLDTGGISTYAGNGTFQGPWVEGALATAASLSDINDLLVDRSGNLLIASSAAYPTGAIRRVDANTGRITTLVGDGPNESLSNVPALQATVIPAVLTFDSSGRLFFADDFRLGVFKLDSNNQIVAVAGGKRGDSDGFSGDNGPALDARFRGIRSLAFDSAGNLFLVDRFNHRVRAIRGPIP